MTSSTADREILVSRVFDAPRELVFGAWSDPVHIGNWLGPRGFSTTTHKMEFREGGEWRYTMHGPDGTDYPNLVVYTRIVPPERIEYEHGDDKDPHQFHVIATFEDIGGKTRVTFRMTFRTVEELERSKAFGAVEGAHDTLDRLAEHLAAKA